ncbi:MAG: outer membrane protein assembly factor BamD [Deltaproteobacteria bacterium]|nr:outer membrane protein assembly factor BamD [Deltaproteobacteria bacterium]
MGRTGAIAAIVAIVAVVACGGPQEASGPLSYSSTARRNYDKGMRELRTENCLEAVRYFEHTKRRFPFSRYAALSELRIADCDYLTQKYVEAIAGYRQFIRFHPTHQDVAYATFRIALSNYRQIPTSWFIIPPPHERDLASARDSLRDLRRYLSRYPRHRYSGWAKKLEGKCLRLLAQHEMYVARFYLERGEYQGAIGRLDGIFRNYRGSGLEAEAMLLQARTYLDMRRNDEARQTLERLVETFPRSTARPAAERYLRFLRDGGAARSPGPREGGDG